jgi:hypothetical protein
MLQKRATVFLTLILLALASVGLAQDKLIRAADIPREFTGEYEWRGTKKLSTVSLQIDKIEEDDKTIHFFGRDFYMPGNYEMKIEGTIDTKSYLLTISEYVTISEHDPLQAQGVTDGSFIGTISADLQTIEAVWTTISTGQKGDLKLQAKRTA